MTEILLTGTLNQNLAAAIAVHICMLHFMDLDKYDVKVNYDHVFISRMICGFILLNKAWPQGYKTFFYAQLS